MARKTHLSKKFDLALSVDSTALFCPNPTEFYSKTYISEEVANNYRIVPGVKYQTEIAGATFSQLIQADGCAFVGATSTLSAFTLAVTPISVMDQICRVDLETSFISDQMVKGANGNWEVPDFMTWYWDRLAAKAGEEIAILRWQGAPTAETVWAGGTFSYGATAVGSAGTGANALAKGLERRLSIGVITAASANALGNVIGVGATPGTITSSNVLNEMNAVYTRLGASASSIAYKTQDLRFHVSSDIGAAYKIAAAAGNTTAYITKEQELTYLGIPVIIEPGMSAKKMVLTLKDNLIFVCDGIDDDKNLKAINMEETTGDSYMRTRAHLKVGFYAINGPEIVYYA